MNDVLALAILAASIAAAHGLIVLLDRLLCGDDSAAKGLR